jgi:hypothetical protein
MIGEFAACIIQVFLYKKMADIRKSPTDSDLLQWLRQLGNGFPPVTVTVVKEDYHGPRGRGAIEVDALVEIQWRRRKYRFATEIEALSTPRTLDSAILKLRRYSEGLGLHPLVVTTYLSEDKLQWLEREGVSGLDLCGNGVVVVPGESLVWRSGAANKYPRGNAIQNVYRGNSSLVARAFLLKASYGSAQELLAEVLGRWGEVTLATVSKVCSALAEDLLIERRRINRTTRLKLLQPDRLLDALAANFQSPVVGRRLVGKCSLQAESLADALIAWRKAQGQRIARTGADSVDRYATMVREPVARFYCTQLATLLNVLGGNFVETARFPNIEFLETTDPAAYFDVRDDLIASPIQCFLELQAGDKRDQDTAEQVRRLILRNANDRRDRL